jgi:2-oxoisovalerate dehydrogenase E1 component
MELLTAARTSALASRRPPTETQTGKPCAGHSSSLGPGPLQSIPERLLQRALTIRKTEERLLVLFSEGKLFGTVHTCIGQEWTGVAVAAALRPGDFLFSNHRGHGHYLAWTDDVEGLVAEVMGRQTGVCGGRGGSQHLCRSGFFSNGIQGGIVPVAAGLAMSHLLRGNAGVAVAFIGDGTLGEGVVYETLNIASRWSLPMLIVLEDNGIAQSTRCAETLAGTIEGRAWAFDIDVLRADTWQPADLISRTAEAVNRLRATRRPALLHVTTYRLRAHSKGDDERDPAEVAEFTSRDLLTQLVTHPDVELSQRLAAIDQRLTAAVAAAEAAPFADAGTPPAETQPQEHHGRAGMAGHTQGPTHQGDLSLDWAPLHFEPCRVVDGIREALVRAMERDERIILLGEDVRDPYGGAFKVTAGLSERFGERVRNTPISEAALMGLGNGLALSGLRPVVEIMFGDFLTLIADQFVNHAAKFAWMYNHQASVPLVIRTPMGGYRGYGPTHSQCLEKHFLGVPGTRVLALHERYDPGRLYQELLASVDRPTLVIENKGLYGRQAASSAPDGWELQSAGAPFPTIRLTPDGEPLITLVTYGGMMGAAEAALRELREAEDVLCEVLAPTELYPLALQPIADSVCRTGRLLVVEEGQGFAGWGGELISQLACLPGIQFEAGRVCAAEHPIPASRPAEAMTLPSTAQIVAAAARLIRGA